jgi:hypothetical protein
MPDTIEIFLRNNQEIRQVLAGLHQGAAGEFEEQQVFPLLRRAGEPAQAEPGGSREPVTAVLNRLRDAAASHDASGPFAVQPPG